MKRRLAGNTLSHFGILKLVLSVAVASASLHAETKLSLTSSSSSTIEIRLDNDQSIAGLQFVLHSSSDIILKEIHNCGRTEKGNWTVASNRLNDSTLSVVIVSTEMVSFSNGDGIIAEVSLSRVETGSSNELVSFTHVVAADSQANLVSITADGLTLNPQSARPGVSASDFSFGQNYPNPFNPSTRMSYELKKDAFVRLAIYDLAGREISKLVDEYQTKGMYGVTWNSSVNPSGQLSSGTYFARLQVGENVVTRKMVVMK